MFDQAHYWSKAAREYDELFVDPYRADVRSPLLTALTRLAERGYQSVADLGCGTGPLLSFLAERFKKVHAVDFAPGMLERARGRCQGLRNVEFHALAMTDLRALPQPLDVVVAVNSLVLQGIPELEKSLRQIRKTLRPGGVLLGILPAMDSVHYYTMLLLDRALAQGKPAAAARKNAADHAEHGEYDFAFSDFNYLGLEQHFWHPFEIPYRLQRAGFRSVRRARVWLSWEQFACGEDLKDQPPPWDWFFVARR